MSPKKNANKDGDKVSPAHGKQTELIAESSDDESPRRSLARDRQPKPEDAKKVNRSLKSAPKQSKKKS